MSFVRIFCVIIPALKLPARYYVKGRDTADGAGPHCCSLRLCTPFADALKAKRVIAAL